MFNLELPDDKIIISDDALNLNLSDLDQIKQSLIEQLGLEEENDK